MDSAIIAVCTIVTTAVALFCLFKVIKLQRQLTTLSSGVDKKNLTELTKEYMDTLSKTQHDVEMMNREFSSIRAETAKFFRKVGLVRYQGFNDTGGNQSFTLALLDENNSGIILTTLYRRDFSRTYVRRVTKGNPDLQLSDEEKKALNEAIVS